MKKIIENKKGEIPITILVLGILIICILAIVSFYTSSSNVQKGFDIQLVKEAKVIAEKADLYVNLGFSQEETDSLLSITKDPESGKRYIFLERGDISITYYLP